MRASKPGRSGARVLLGARREARWSPPSPSTRASSILAILDVPMACQPEHTPATCCCIEETPCFFPFTPTLVPCQHTAKSRRQRATMSRDAKLVAVTYAGGRKWTEWHKMRVVFQDFAGMDEKHGEYVRSDVMVCHGYEWQVRVYPREDNLNHPEEFVAVYLCSLSANGENPITAEFTLDSLMEGPLPPQSQVEKYTFKERNQCCGYDNFLFALLFLILRRQVLVDGNLTIELDIRVAVDKLPTWSPPNTVCADMLKLLESADGESADVVFEIRKGTEAKETELFHSHGAILMARAPALAALSEGYNERTPIPIPDHVEPDIFRMVLRFCVRRRDSRSMRPPRQCPHYN